MENKLEEQHKKGKRKNLPTEKTPKRTYRSPGNVSELIFSFFPYAVYPVGVTTHWCYFLLIIAHNSLPVYGIAAKVGTEMRLYTPPSVCHISRQLDKAFAFYSSFCKCAKRGRKIRRKETKAKPIFEVAYLGNA